MQLRIERFSTDEFKIAISDFLRASLKPMPPRFPPRFILERVYALASDGREQLLKRSVNAEKALWTYKGRFCEREILTGLRFEFGDRTNEIFKFPYERSTVDTAELEFDLGF